MPDHPDAWSAQYNSPLDVPPHGWKDVAKRVWAEVSKQNLFLVAGGVSYAALLAIFPGLVALVSVYGLLFNSSQIDRQVRSLAGMMPASTLHLLSQQLHRISSVSSGSLGFGLVIGILVALWSASRGMSGLMTAINIAYEQKETRSFIRFNLIAVVLTVGAVIGVLLAIALVGVLPVAAPTKGAGSFLGWLMLILEWPLLMALMIVGLAVIYRYAPNRERHAWLWVTPGSLAATGLWIGGSILFSIYVGNFASYDRTYGSLGGAVILMTWLYLSAFVVLLGAAIDTQMHKQIAAGQV